MNFRIKPKNHAVDSVIGFLTKSISKPYSRATAMPPAWELTIKLTLDSIHGRKYHNKLEEMKEKGHSNQVYSIGLIEKNKIKRRPLSRMPFKFLNRFASLYHLFVTLKILLKFEKVNPSKTRFFHLVPV